MIASIAPSTCVVYLRLSETDEDDALARQERDCRALAERHGLTVVELLKDDGRSAYKAGVRRDGFDAALAAVVAGRAQALIVWKLDRLTRRGIGQAGTVLDTLEASGGYLLACMDGIDTRQSGGRLVVAVLSEQARAESANTSLRVSHKAAADRARGLWARPAPYGYRAVSRRLVPDPVTAPRRRQMIDRLLAGWSLRRIAAEANELGWPTPAGGKSWGASSVRQMLLSATAAGFCQSEATDGARSTPGGGHGVRGTSPGAGLIVDAAGEPVSFMAEGAQPIATLAEWRRCCAVLTGRSRFDGHGVRTGAGRIPTSLLGGLLVCGECGGGMKLGGTSGYICSAYSQGGRAACVGTSVRRETVEEDVVGRALRRLAALEPGDPALEAVASRWAARVLPETEAERVGLLAAAEVARATRDDLEEARYVRREFPGADGAARYARLRERIEAQVQRAEHALAALPPVVPDVSILLDGVNSRESFEASTLERQRDLLRDVVERIVVRKAPGRGARYTPDRLIVTWVNENDESPRRVDEAVDVPGASEVQSGARPR